jgi:hypothetical protein
MDISGGIDHIDRGGRMLRILTSRVSLLTLAATMTIGIGSAGLSADLDPKGINIQLPKEI